MTLFKETRQIMNFNKIFEFLVSHLGHLIAFEEHLSKEHLVNEVPITSNARLLKKGFLKKKFKQFMRENFLMVLGIPRA